MSLTVPAEMLKQAERGRVEEMDFVAVVRASLPRAWRIVERLVEQLRSSDTELESYGPGAMDDATRGELLRMLAGTAIRRTTERHFGVQLLFQNCHNVAVINAGQEDLAIAEEFCSIKSQILNQQPQYQFC
jgi:hypothetical protein